MFEFCFFDQFLEDHKKYIKGEKKLYENGLLIL